MKDFRVRTLYRFYNLVYRLTIIDKIKILKKLTYLKFKYKYEVLSNKISIIQSATVPSGSVLPETVLSAA